MDVFPQFLGNFFAFASDACLDFLFPRPASLKRLEALSAGELLLALPQAEAIDTGQGKDQAADTIAVFDYKHPDVRALVWELKYKGDRKAAELFGAVLYDVLRHELAERAFFENFSPRESGLSHVGALAKAGRYLLVPIPTSRARLRKRGHNQTELLAEAVLKLDRESGSPLFAYAPHMLEKVSHTESQARAHATKRERKKNLEGTMTAASDKASAAEAESLRGACVILLDDVTTSGATFAEAKRALKAAGVRKVLCVAVAH